MSRLTLKHQREKVHLEYKQQAEKAEESGKLLVYPNQKEAAMECISHFQSGKLLVLLIAQPGTGKTGTVLEMTKQLTTHNDDELCVMTNDIYTISGMNDVDWVNQFREKMLPSFQANIHHRGTLNKNAKDINDIRNGVIICDECHIASGKNMTVSKVLQSTGLTDCHVAMERYIRMLDVSATPDSVAWDIEAWGNRAAKVRLLPGSSYKGFEVMLSENRIRQAPSFSTYPEVQEWVRMFNDRYHGVSKKYFPVRVKNSEAMGFIRRAIVEFGWTEMTHNSETRVADIDELMKYAPERHTVIFIKEFWRASKRLVRLNVGGSYEYVPKTRNVSTASQSLIGRFCDNFEYEGDELNPELRPIHFGDKQSIESYVSWFNNDCDFRKVDYKSTSIKSVGGYVKARPSKAHSSNITNLTTVTVANRDPHVHKRVPVVIEVSRERIDEIDASGDDKTAIKNEIITRLSSNADYDEFIQIITTSPCFQLSRPKFNTARSYKIHITDVVDAKESKSKYAVLDLSDKALKTKSCWQVYIDNEGCRLCVLWQVFDVTTPLVAIPIGGGAPI
jgi:hypothetical protein